MAYYEKRNIVSMERKLKGVISGESVVKVNENSMVKIMKGKKLASESSWL